MDLACAEKHECSWIKDNCARREINIFIASFYRFRHSPCGSLHSKGWWQRESGVSSDDF
jgi:hypothetical protein